MSITNKRAFVHQANKKRTEASDLMKKNRIVVLLRERFGIHALGLVDEYIFFRNKETNHVQIRQSNPTDVADKEELFRKYDVNKIDLFVKQRYPDIIIEIDGLEHGFFDKVTESEQTTDRNRNYFLGGYTEEKKNFLKLTTEDLSYEDDILTMTIEYKLGIKSKVTLGHHAKTSQSEVKN